MTAVARIEVLTAELAFRFSFGHARAARRSSTNVYVRLHLDDGTIGHGEGVPREYVTGETVQTAVSALQDLGPQLVGRQVAGPDEVPAVFEDAVGHAATAREGPPPLAARCALELAYLDACGRRFGRSVRSWLAERGVTDLRYDAVIPFAPPGVLAALAVVVRVAGPPKVKVKVGGDLDTDLRALGILRRVLGPSADIRVDANAAWTAEEAITAIGRMRRFGVRAVEQPVAADDHEGLRRVTAAVPEDIIVDESLRTVQEATTLAEGRACDAFNIRVSKCGGLLHSMRIARIAAEHGLDIVVGAQVGESGILSAAGRQLAASIGAPRYLEGSAGRLLLRHDLTRESVMPGWRGRAPAFSGPGLGVEVDGDVLRRYGRVVGTSEARTAGSG
ncbi:MAG: L-Ala-D/L-Glu epimerase [Solirubrobacteraceae bacterium]|jgi:muconate cycloisomerase|nr:L-Ala-D/L-Glu epimerase [Solirubrobacteraceae bacterium]